MRRFYVQLSKSEQFWGWIYWVFSELALVNILRFLNAALPGMIPAVVLDFIYLAANFLFLTVIMRKFLICSFKYGWERLGRVLQSAFWAYGLYWLLNIAMSYFCLWLMPDFVNLNDNTIAALSDQQRTLTHIGAVLLAPVTEELLYRGLLFGSLYEKKPWLGYTVSIVVFSAVHVIGYIRSYSPLGLLVAFLQYLPAGFCLAWAYDRSKSIYAPILLHMAVNQLAMMFM